MDFMPFHDGIHGIPLNPWVSWWIPWNPMDSMEFHGIHGIPQARPGKIEKILWPGRAGLAQRARLGVEPGAARQANPVQPGRAKFFYGFHGIPWNPRNSMESTMKFMKFHGFHHGIASINTPRLFKKCHDMQWNCMEFQRIPWYSIYGMPWKSKQSNGIPWNKIPWKS